MSGRKENSGDPGPSGSTAPTEDTQGTPDASVVLPHLVPPSKDEANRYYNGFLRGPLLVGRTTAGVVVWTPPPSEWTAFRYDEEPEERLVTPIGGRHRALPLLEGLLPQLKDAIHVLPWTSIDVFRIGSRKVVLRERPVTVWIGIRDAHEVKWDNVALALRRVRRILDSAGLPEVECEIREARTTPLAFGPPPIFPPVVKETFSTEWLAKRGISTSLGQTIIPSLPETKSVQGTLGLYLRPARTLPQTPVWALTCRHVCLPLPDHANERYSRSDPEHGHSMYMPSTETLDDAIEGVENLLRGVRQELQGSGESGHAQLAAITETLGLLKSMQPWETRQIGSVFASPPIAAMLGPDGSKRYTRDWGLVRLQDDKFPAAYTKNQVDLRVTDWNFDSPRLTKFLKKHCRLPSNFSLPDDGLLPIKGVVPMTELEWICSGKADGKVPFWCDPNVPAADKTTDKMEPLKRAPPIFSAKEDRVLVVGKRGSTTGLTWGATSEFRSVVRTPFGQETIETRELAVVGSLDDMKTAFSKKGDSGSVVFDITGRAVAMITSGSDSGDAIDVTYCTPMELVLADISKELGEEVVFL